MLIDIEELIARQLTVTEVTEVTFPDGRKTVLHPVAYVAQLADPAARLSLDGAWRVTKWPFPAHEASMVSPTIGDSAWPTVAQPGKVFTQDVSTPTAQIPNWNRVLLTQIDPEDGAVLRRTVDIPSAWTGKRIYLTFDGIYPGGRIYLNGVLLGEHTSGLTPVEYDVTDLVTPGTTALVAVRLLRRHPFVQMDMPRHGGEFAGLSQPAYLHATESCQLAEYRLIPAIDETLTHATLAGELLLRHHGTATTAGEVTVTLTDPHGHYAASVVLPVEVAPGTSVQVPVALAIAQPQLWNDEFPHLYQVAITLCLAGQATQTVSYRTGFRRLDFTGARPRLNGNPVKFRGVNHLTYHPEHGLYTPESWLRQCLTLMKKANINCIRTHYLGPRALAGLCDELGLYLLQELPIDWGTDYIADPRWVGPALQRIEGGILRDRHHPAVMVWSVGNENMPSKQSEADDGYNHLHLYNRFAKTLDPSRHTMFPPPGPANRIRGILEVRVGDIADTHYSFNHIKRFLETGVVENPIAWDGGFMSTTREEALAHGWSGVWYSSEYGIANLQPDVLNAPYGDIINDVPADPDSGRSSLEVFTERLRREWGYMRSEPSCLGGAYFPWLCGAAGDNPWGWTVWAEDNDWGVVTADLLPKPEFWAMRVLFSPVWISERATWEAGQTSVRLELSNQYNAIDLKDCTLRTMLGWAKSACTREWQDIPVACPPGETRTVEIPLWQSGALESLQKGIVTVLRVVLLDPRGFRPLTQDILIVPKTVEKEERTELLIGPDAKM